MVSFFDSSPLVFVTKIINVVELETVLGPIASRTSGYFVVPTSGVWVFRLKFDDQCAFWIGHNALNPTLSNINKWVFWSDDWVSYSATLYVGIQYPILFHHSQRDNSSVTRLTFEGPGVAARSDGSGYFFSGSIPFTMSVPVIGTNKMYLNTSNRVNLLNSGYQLNVIVECLSDMSTDANGPYVVLKNVETGLYIRHTNYWINEYPYISGQIVFAWKFQYDTESKRALLYNVYNSSVTNGGSYFGYDSTSGVLKISHVPATSNNLLLVSKVTLSPGYFPPPTLANDGLSSEGTITLTNNTRQFTLSSYFSGAVRYVDTTDPHGNASITCSGSGSLLNVMGNYRGVSYSIVVTAYNANDVGVTSTLSVTESSPVPVLVNGGLASEGTITLNDNTRQFTLFDYFSNAVRYVDTTDPHGNASITGSGSGSILNVMGNYRGVSYSIVVTAYNANDVGVTSTLSVTESLPVPVLVNGGLASEGTITLNNNTRQFTLSDYFSNAVRYVDTTDPHGASITGSGSGSILIVMGNYRGVSYSIVVTAYNANDVGVTSTLSVTESFHVPVLVNGGLASEGTITLNDNTRQFTLSDYFSNAVRYVDTTDPYGNASITGTGSSYILNIMGNYRGVSYSIVVTAYNANDVGVTSSLSVTESLPVPVLVNGGLASEGTITLNDNTRQFTLSDYFSNAVRYVDTTDPNGNASITGTGSSSILNVMGNYRGVSYSIVVTAYNANDVGVTSSLSVTESLPVPLLVNGGSAFEYTGVSGLNVEVYSNPNTIPGSNKYPVPSNMVSFFDSSSPVFVTKSIDGVELETILGTNTYVASRTSGHFVVPTSGVWVFRMNFDDQCAFWIGDNALNPTVSNINKWVFYADNWVSYSVTLDAGIHYPILFHHLQTVGVRLSRFTFEGPGVAARSNGLGYFFSKSMPFTMSVPTVSTNKMYLNTSSRINLLNSGNQMNVVAECTTGIYSDANGPYVALKDVATGLYIRHMSLVLMQSSFSAGNLDYAFKFQYDTTSKRALLYNPYGGYYFGYNSASGFMKINNVPTTSNNLLFISKV